MKVAGYHVKCDGLLYQTRSEFLRKTVKSLNRGKPVTNQKQPIWKHIHDDKLYQSKTSIVLKDVSVNNYNVVCNLSWLTGETDLGKMHSLVKQEVVGRASESSKDTVMYDVPLHT